MSARHAEVTVGMPTLNNARTLQRAIDSVRAQTFGDWRLIISDDGSVDGTDQIAARAAAEDPRIRLIRQPVRLGFLNFKVPLDQAESPCFAWLAGDDYWHPDFLSLTLQALRAGGPAISALPQAAFIGPPARPIPNLGFLKGDAAGRIRRYLAHPGGTRMYGLMQTDPLRTAFPPKAFHAFDWYLMVRLLAQGPQLSVPQTLLFREETPWWHYAEDHAAAHPAGLAGAFPALEMSRHLIRDRGIPARALPALIGLNLRKHEEIVALTRPASFRRRRLFYRSLGLPIARDPDRQRQMVERPQAGGHHPPAQPRRTSLQADVTAILTFRNASSTLAAALEHLDRLGCRVIAVDHGSTDASRSIAAARLGGLVEKLIDEPWTGTFDLQRQLRLKRQLIGAVTTGWILHADADEFLDPPKGLTLVDALSQADAAGHLAFACDEQLFLPLYEDEEHDPRIFQTTMTTWVTLQEHDPKQRLFRRDADLDLWLRTGGHSVTRDADRIAATRLTLRHYPGLSLDDLRGQYLARVFAPDDRARHWHTNRAAAESFQVVAPDPQVFKPEATVRHLPFLQPCPLPAPHPLPEAVDLWLLSDHGDQGLAARIAALLPGLRVAEVAVTDLAAMRRMCPVLQVLSHPAGLHGRGVQRSLERSRAQDWTRRVALARQWAVDRNAAYSEIRVEELDIPELWFDRLVRLWQPPVLRGAQGFLPAAATQIVAVPWANPVRCITRALAADLGYR
ncbi:glycosyltransferase family 2 protein [Tabrizicola sp.]|uniref:glycosyltransferase family 2 protein n=1 Tax=Tabrizicola sp. TaxID=2005166 RepID=UPI0027366998|nr:glycosyltransferase [Tabrizicola sp.]MDP3195606.1 glycosyltransferase [Tabrizicola sp.]